MTTTEYMALFHAMLITSLYINIMTEMLTNIMMVTTPVRTQTINPTSVLYRMNSLYTETEAPTALLLQAIPTTAVTPLLEQKDIHLIRAGAKAPTM